MDIEETKTYIREQIKAKYGTLSAYDVHRGYKTSYTCMILNQCSRSIPNWLLADFGLCKVVSYQPKLPKESK